MSREKNRAIKFTVVFVLLLIAVIVAMRLGSVSFRFQELWEILLSPEKSTAANIIKNVRMPRIIVALFVGANLAVSGTLLQAVMQNPLSDPGLTGVSAGASLGAMIVIILFPHLSYFLPVIAFLGGALGCTMTYTLAWKEGLKPIRIILTGIAVNAMFGGLIGIISIFFSDRIQNSISWMNGSMSGKSWHDVHILVVYSVVALLASVFCIRYANILQLGDKMATNLGINTNYYRVMLSLVAVLLAAISVSITGPIAFVGLVVPHIGRTLVGSNYKHLLPFSVILGSLLLLVADTVGRYVLHPIELPVGIIMALIGAPFFLYLLKCADASRRG